MRFRRRGIRYAQHLVCLIRLNTIILSYLCADGLECDVHIAASKVAAAIVRKSVPSTPVIAELRRQAQQRCKERRADLGYAMPDSDSEASVTRRTRVLGSAYGFAVIVIFAEISDFLFAQAKVATTRSSPSQVRLGAAYCLFLLVWQGIP